MSDIADSTPPASEDVALVTGGARGIGLGIATRLAHDGHPIVLLDRDEEALASAEATLAAEVPGATVRGVAADVTSLDGVRNAVEQVATELGPIDILVNNAGILRDRRLVNLEEADWDSVIATNLKSNFVLAKALVPSMMEQHYGRIVNISSRAWLGAFGQTNYAAAKGGVVSFTRSLALELATHGVTVNAVAPGIIDTDMFRSMRVEDQERLQKTVPVQRIGSPGDVANAVAFFCSRASSYVTGQLIYVCGGRSLSSPSV